ncbi:MAG TPA: YtxH domain-containing protein [Gemmatimonadales bacterium]|nr:YtxH domain-containing protein [Gemmatimonadales bacterium]
MSERGSGFGPFLLGLTIGAALGLLFAPEPGEATRTKVTQRLRGLRDLAAEKAGELGQLLDAEAEDQTDEPSAREALEHRLTDAKRRRRRARPGPKDAAALPPPGETRESRDGGEEEDEPLA